MTSCTRGWRCTFGEAALASQILPEVRRVLAAAARLVVAVKTSAGDDGQISRACGDAKVLMRPKKWEALVGGADLAVRASEAAMRNGTDDEAAAWKAAGASEGRRGERRLIGGPAMIKFLSQALTSRP